MGDELLIVCAWCPAKGRDPYLSGPRDAPPERISHGMCRDCEAEVTEELKQKENNCAAVLPVRSITP